MSHTFAIKGCKFPLYMLAQAALWWRSVADPRVLRAVQRKIFALYVLFALPLYKRHKACAVLTMVLGLTVLTLGLLSGFVPQREGPEIRRRVSPVVAVLHAEDIPAHLNAIAPGEGRSAVRRSVNSAQALPAQLISTDADKRNQMVMFLDEGVSLSTVDGPKIIENAVLTYNYAPMLPLDGSPEALYLTAALPADYGESLDTTGKPLRWQGESYASYRRIDPECLLQPYDQSPAPLEEAMLAALPALRPAGEALRPNLRPFDSGDAFSRARRYKSLVEQAAARFGLSLDLVYAIIHNESNFAPVLVSSRSAMGLMQLLPSTAGGEVHTFLYGHPAKVSFADLANPETNIRYGTAYLHLLLNRHLAQVKNRTSREYCAVAAYNMGPNGFLRLFSADRDTAIEMINKMTPDEVYTRLTQHLPVMETRYFVAKVARSREEFAAFE